MSYTYFDKTNELHHVHCVISIVLFNRYQFRELIKKNWAKIDDHQDHDLFQAWGLGIGGIYAFNNEFKKSCMLIMFH